MYGERYGWAAPGETVSGLEDEYSLSQGMPRLLYVKAPAPQRQPRLAELLARFRTTTRLPTSGSARPKSSPSWSPPILRC